MLPLLQATQNPPPEIGSRSLVYNLGPWKGDNLLTGIESFFQKNAYHPFAICGNPDCGKTGPIPISTTSHKNQPEQTPPTRSIEHFCDGNACFKIDPTNFRNNRHHTRDRSFLDKARASDAVDIDRPFRTARMTSEDVDEGPTTNAPNF